MAHDLKLPAGRKGQKEAADEPTEARPVLDGSGHSNGFDVAEWIEEIGFGLYQVHVFILSAGFIVAEGAELQMASGVANAVIAEFGIVSPLGRSMLMTCTFIGFAAGTIASGPLGDVYGRRVPMLCGYVGVVLTAMATYFAPTVTCIYIVRFILGFFGGIGIPTALVTLSEVSPRTLRGMSTAALGAAYCLGDLWAALGLWLVLPDLQTGPWRILLFWAAAPATSLIIFGLLSPVARHDTPFFLAAKGRNSEAAAAMRLVAEMNRKPELAFAYSPSADAAADAQDATEASGPSNFWRAALAMFEWPMALYSAILGFLFFAKDFAYYGMGVFWPLAWAELDVGNLLPAQDLALTAVLGVPGVGIAIVMMYGVDRKPALAISGLSCAVGAHLISRLEIGDSRGMIGVVLFKLFFPTWQMVTMLLPCEIFPTQIRSLAYGSVAVLGRIATIIAPTVVESSHAGFLGACSCLALLSACGAMILPETKDVKLVDKLVSSRSKASAYGTV
mmetsp:Transcript_8823/g.23622  ORF Transcript_8823/g.23622 Transcript_8823/m.23622 type:complete len:504 (-) Transcript_8823:22-1533(-)